MREALPQAAQVLAIAQTLLKDEILGVYLYGSAACGGLRPDSDIDLLLIIRQALSDAVRAELTRQLCAVSGPAGCAAKRPLEVTIIRQAELRPLQFPPRCEFMYGEWLRSEIEAGGDLQAHCDPDLLLLLWQTRKNSLTLQGQDSCELIAPISFELIKEAIRLALPAVLAGLKGDERNVLLTLARMWFTLGTEDLASKDAAAKWVLPKLPAAYLPLLVRARDAYLGKIADEWESAAGSVRELAEYMAGQIEQQLEAKPQEHQSNAVRN